MHAGIFEAGWDDAALVQRHRAAIASDYRGRGRTVIALDWPLVHHERGPQIYAINRAYDYVTHRTTVCQAVVTAVVANREVLDGLDVSGHAPWNLHAAEASLHATAQASYAQMDAVRHRVLEL
ncbi:MAG TPA: hypothetical protein VIH59_04500 [Candidatus Tectomicrobia bacterium]|jgi:hypothetical protein